MPWADLAVLFWLLFVSQFESRRVAFWLFLLLALQLGLALDVAPGDVLVVALFYHVAMLIIRWLLGALNVKRFTSERW